MKACNCLLAVGCALFLGMFATDAQPEGAAQQVNLENQPGVDVQTRGPIHEAFAQPALPKPMASPVVTKQPPDPVNELPPDQKPEGNQVQWLPGYWAWDEDRADFLWVSGIWRVPPPGRQWVPGYWQQATGGWSWITGYWGMTGETQVDLLPAPPEPVEEAIPAATQCGQSLFIPGILCSSGQPLLVAAGALGRLPGRLGLGAGALLLDARRLRFRARVLGS